METEMLRCTSCEEWKSPDEFYTRSGAPHLRVSECKACMKLRNQTVESVPPDAPRVMSERLAVDALKRQGIFATTGRASLFSSVDVVAFGCIRIEVKYSRLNTRRRRAMYTFNITPQQIQRGLLADIVMLICDNGERCTYHLFPAKHPVFYKQGRLKHGFTFAPGVTGEGKHSNNRLIMTQHLMDAAQDNWKLVWAILRKISESLKNS